MTLALLFRPSTTPLESSFWAPETVEDQLAVITHGAGDLFHGLDARSHDLAAPFVEEFCRRGGRVVIPELLKDFLEKVGADGLQVVAENIAKPETLFCFQILFPFEEQPA